MPCPHGRSDVVECVGCRGLDRMPDNLVTAPLISDGREARGGRAQSLPFSFAHYIRFSGESHRFPSVFRDILALSTAARESTGR